MLDDDLDFLRTFGSKSHIQAGLTIHPGDAQGFVGNSFADGQFAISQPVIASCLICPSGKNLFHWSGNSA